MAPEVVATALLVLVFIGLVAIRVPMVYAIGFATLVTSLYLDIDLMMMAQNVIKNINVYTLLAVPFFILAGEVMGAGGISARLIGLSRAMVGWIRGGLAMVNIVASMFFGGISGSSSADTASIGPIMIPMMEKEGYDKDFSTCVTMASSVQGILIPPSQNMVIFSLAAGGVSIGKLFMAGYVPGVLLAVALMIYSYRVSVKRNYPISNKFVVKEVVVNLKDSIWGLITVLIVVVGVVAGLFTATESAAIAAVWALFVGLFIYKEIKVKDIGRLLGNCVSTISKILILMGTSGAFGWMLTYLKIPEKISAAVFSITDNRIVILIFLNILLLLLGTLIDMASIILIVTPIILPVMTQIGIDPVHLGVIMILNLGIGLLTPPVGTTLFIGSAISDIKIEKLAKSMIPFYAVMLLVLILITYFPGVVMTIPNLLYK